MIIKGRILLSGMVCQMKNDVPEYSWASATREFLQLVSWMLSSTVSIFPSAHNMLLPCLPVDQFPASQSFPPHKKGGRDVGVVGDVALSGFNQGKFEGNPT